MPTRPGLGIVLELSLAYRFHMVRKRIRRGRPEKVPRIEVIWEPGQPPSDEGVRLIFEMLLWPLEAEAFRRSGRRRSGE